MSVIKSTPEVILITADRTHVRSSHSLKALFVMVIIVCRLQKYISALKDPVCRIKFNSIIILMCHFKKKGQTFHKHFRARSWSFQS